MRFHVLLVTLLTTHHAVAFAQNEPKPQPPPPKQLKLSLQECIYLALDHNVDLEVARFQPWIEDENILAAHGTFDHVLYSTTSGGEEISASRSSLSGATKLEDESFSEALGVKRVLPFGLSYDLSFSTSRSESNSSFATINPSWTEELKLDLTMPLLKGRGEDAKYSTVIIARHTKQVAVERFEKALVDQLVAVQQAYWDLVFAREHLEVKRQSERVAEQLLKENTTKFEKGVLAKVDVTEAESGLAAQREGILTAENQWATAIDKLKRLINPDLLADDAILLPADAPQGPEKELDEKAALASAIEQAFKRRPEYKELAPQIASQDQTIRKAGNDLLPKLDLTTSGALVGLDGTFSDSNEELRSRDFHDWSVGLSFEWPFENRASRGALHRAELERRKLELQRRSLEDQILVELRSAIRDVKTTEKRIEATRRARTLAQERFDGEMNRREAGLRTTFHVLDAEERLTEARTNEIKALIDYTLAVMSLRRAEGILLEHHGVLVQEHMSPRLQR